MAKSKVKDLFSVVFLGDDGVGKSSLMFRVFNRFETCSYGSGVLGAEIRTTEIPPFHDGDIIRKVTFFAFDELYWKIHENRPPPKKEKGASFSADAILFVFDVLDSQSMENVKNYIEKILTGIRTMEPVYVLIGNKIDQRNKTENHIDIEKGREYARSLEKLYNIKIKYFESSTFDNKSILKVLDYVYPIIFAK